MVALPGNQEDASRFLLASSWFYMIKFCIKTTLKAMFLRLFKYASYIIY